MLTSSSSIQTSRLGAYTLTAPLQTTTYSGKIFPVFRKGSNFLSRTESSSSFQWTIGSTVGSPSGGYLFQGNSQCPEFLSKATAYNGAYHDLAPREWSITCNSGELIKIENILLLHMRTCQSIITPLC